jgi:hypothetical protein
MDFLWLFASKLLIARGGTRSMGRSNRDENGPGRSAWAGRPRAILARFGPVFRVRAPHVIVD